MLIKKRLFLGLLLAVATGAVFAQERGTKEEAVSMMAEAIKHTKQAGLAKALDDFTNDKANWVSKDLYVSAIDSKGNSLAHGFNPKQVGRNLWELKDPNGVLLVQDLIKTGSEKGEGWVSYQWPDPLTKKMADKSSLVRRVPGADAFLIIGIYR